MSALNEVLDPDFAGLFINVTANDQRAAMDRAKSPGNRHLRQYGERPTKSDSQRIVPFHARQGIRG